MTAVCTFKCCISSIAQAKRPGYEALPQYTAGVFIALSIPTSHVWGGKKESKGKVANPSKFKVSYSLRKNSGAQALLGAPGAFGTNSKTQDQAIQIAVNILDGRFFPIKAFVLRNVKKTDRIESLWDGRDVYGKEMPAGFYYASLSILYSDKTKDIRFFRFVKD